MGKIHATTEDYNLALNEFRKALQLKPEMAEAVYNQILVLDEQGKFQEAARTTAKLLKMKEQPPGTKMLNGIVTVHLGDAKTLAV